MGSDSLLNSESSQKNFIIAGEDYIMLEDKFVRAGVFFGVAFSVPVLLSLLTDGDLNRGIQIGVVMGVIFGVISQYFEPKPTSAEQ